MRENARVPFDYKPLDSKPRSAKGRTTRRPRCFVSALMFPLLGGFLGLGAAEKPVPETLHAPRNQAAPEAEAEATPSEATPSPKVAMFAPELEPASTQAPAPDVPETEMEIEMEAPAPALIEPPPPEPAGEEIVFKIRRHDTLERIFRRLDLSLEDLAAMRRVPGIRQSLDRITPGERFTVVHEDGAVRSMKRRVSETEILSITRGDAGFETEVIMTPVDIETVYAHGTIDSSLFVAARAAGVSPETILRLASDIFGWDIDFALDIRPGDRFSLIYEQRYRDGEYLGDGRILAAAFVNDGNTYRAVRYASADGKIDDYFTPEGRSVRRQFLRAPLDFRRVSSNFSLRRRHPILNTIRAHQGVDYAAPSGTAVKAAGDGRIRFVGVKGGYGRTIILTHGGRISTLYAHLSRFARGMRTGRRVRQGQIIGYVGRSGAATGPHLHYEYRVNGVHKNPRTVRLPEAAPLPEAYLADFRAKSETILADLERARGSTVAALPGS